MKSLKINLLTGLRFLFVLLASGLVHAQVPTGDYPNLTDASGKKQGAWKKLDTAGTVVYVGQFKDNKPIGVFKYFDTDGRIMSELDFGKGGTTAYCKMYSVTGKVIAKGKYVNQLKDSVWNFYTDDGLKLSVESYKAGVKDGKSTTYFPGTDTIASVTTFVNGKEEGAYAEYYLDGKKKEVANYLHGNLEGTATWYFDDGTINILGAYHNSVKNGKWTYYWINDTNGKYEVKGTETWENGVLKSQAVVIPKDKFSQQVDDPQQGNFNGQNPNGGQ
ncbi:MAG TPA: hypothetical protein VL651_04750 [Bacteroidia bacterium]|jgi:antitoxin component YwqK of YwqJK toxin-antitoxin module|nr:hypothetical protein [Bacteroidia bacterium]